MTRLFGHKKDKTTIAELEEYYANQNQNRTKSGKAWLMAILTILITIIVIVALFYAGRWAYRAITDDSSNNPETTSESTNNGNNIDLPTFDGDIVGQGNPANDDSASSVAEGSESESTTNTEGSVENDGVVTDEAASTSESNVDRVENTVSVGGEEPIPNTGAGDFLITIPFVTAVAGYYISRRHFTNQN